MSNKRTVEELKQAALKAEARAKALRDQAKRQTQMEEARLNVEIIKAVEYWNATRQTPLDKRDIPGRFYEWAEKNKTKFSNE